MSQSIGIAGEKTLLKEQRNRKERIVRAILTGAASVSVLVIALIIIFIFLRGLPLLREVGLIDFLTGTKWNPTSVTNPTYGILPMIVGSTMATLGAIVLGVPLGIACAIFMAEIAPKHAALVLRPAIELLAGIPSVVYGFFGMMTIVPLIRDYLGADLTGGYSILAGSIVLAIMILPTIINISEDAIRAVPEDYREGSLALGATHWQTIRKVLIPSARSGMVAAVILGVGRAIGETMAVIMVMGNIKAMPGSLLESSVLKPLLTFLDSGRTMTATIAMEMSYADPIHRQALFAIGIVLFVVVFALNTVVNLAVKRR